MAKSKQQQNREYYLKHREQILEQRRQHRAIHGQKQYCPEKRREYWRRWYRKHRDKYRENKRLYALTPQGKQNQLERLYRYLDRHPIMPECRLELVEHFIRVTERTVGLTYEFDNGRVYQLV